MSLLSFIRSVRPNLAKLTAQERALFVVGNESADLDSCISSILSAYLFSRAIENKSVFTKFSPKYVFPVINIPREDFKLRPDIVYILSQVGLSANSLVFLDDLINKNTSTFSKSYTCLVDFNKLTSPLSNIFDQRVAGILDHHDDENLYNQSINEVDGPRRVLKSGSCSSIIIDYFHELLGPEFFDFRELEIIKLGLSPILIDTSNLRYRVEDTDGKSYKLFCDFGKLNKDDCEILYKDLEEHKKNIRGMEARDVLRKDYKEWNGSSNILGTSNDNAKLGISSTVQSLEWLYSEHPNLNSDIAKWAHEQNLSICVIMTTSTDSQGNFQRELAIWVNDENKSMVDDIIKKAGSSLQLEPKKISTAPEHNQILTFQQKNIAASRKQVAPLLRNLIYGTSLATL